MKSANVVQGLVIATVLWTSSGCAAIGDIFKAGVWVGVIAVVAVLAVVGGLASMLSSKK